MKKRPTGISAGLIWERFMLLVVSAVNLRKGGTLTILRDCLKYLSDRVAADGDLRVVALVHSRALCEYPGIEYVEMPWCIKSWFHRLWAEYVTMKGISKRLGDVDLWLSLHDTTPNVRARKQEVYCHTSFPFLKLIPRDWAMNPKIPLFALMGRLYYRINVRRNESIIVQQQWFAEAMSDMLGLPIEKFRVIPPNTEICLPESVTAGKTSSAYTFFYASTPDCHKNFETLCQASRMLEAELGEGRFRVLLTVKGDENRYARWLQRKWGGVKSIDFHGLMKKEELFGNYAACDCFVFASRIETWGLPISEYLATQSALAEEAGAGPCLLLADLPYAHETFTAAAAAAKVQASAGYFPPCDAAALKDLMKKCLDNHEDIANR